MAALVAVAAPAQAALTHAFDASFNSGGTLTNPLSIAIDESSGDVYVLNSSNQIQRFDSAGNPVPFSLLGSNILDGCCAGDPDDNHNGYLGGNAVAVDNSGGPNDGNIYVPGGYPGEVDVYSSAGRYLGKLTDNSDPNAQYASYAWCGIAVGVDGSVFVAHERTWANPARSFIDKFRPRRWDPSAVPPQDFPVASTLHNLDPNTCDIAVDSKGTTYTTVNGNSPLRRFSAGLYNLDDPTGVVVDPTSVSSAVDTSDDSVYVNEGSRVARFDASGRPMEVFGAGDFSSASAVAVNPTNHTAYVADPSAGAVRIYTTRTTPDVTDVTASGGQTSATVSAKVAPAGAATVSDCQVEFGTSASYGSSVACDPAAPYSGATDVTVTLPGLNPETTYHYRVVAENANGTTQTPDHTVTTHAVAAVSTDEPTAITQTSATLKGSFVGDGSPTTYHFEWGTSTAYGNTTPESDPVTSSGPVTASADLTGLDVYTPTTGTYHYRLVATNSAGTSFGADRVFHTLPPNLPGLSGVNATDVTPTSATLNAQVNPGLGDTVFRFDYGTSPSYGLRTLISDPIGNDGADHPVSVPVTGLIPGLTYHFRVVATNFTGTTFGEDQTFNTPDAPKIDSTSVSGVTQSEATLEARIRPGFRPTTYHFEYGTDRGYGQTTPESGSIGEDNVQHAASAVIANLAPGTLYHFRVVATNAIGTTVGPDQTVTTAAPPPPPPPARVKCKRGFVKRHGKCVRKKKRRHRHHHRHHHRKTSHRHG